MTRFFVQPEQIGGGRRWTHYVTKTAQLGYTLMELLIVLGIVALLVGILLPVMSLARGRARQSACMNNLEQLHKAFAMYASDHDNFLPPYNNYLSITSDWFLPPRGDLLVASLHSYTQSNELWFCPEDRYADKVAPPQDTFDINHQFSSYETTWPLGLVKDHATIDGLLVNVNSHGKTLEIKTDAPMLKDAEERLTGCGDWAYSHNGRFNILAFDGHASSETVPYN